MAKFAGIVHVTRISKKTLEQLQAQGFLVIIKGALK